MWAFCDELDKIAADKERLYSPGIVAHEGGHARVHAPTGRDMALQYGQFGLGVLTDALARKAPSREAAKRTLIAGGLTSQAITLGDEYASTLVGLKKLKDEKKLSKKELRSEALRLTSAGAGYATSPVAIATHLMKNKELAASIRKGARYGGMLSSIPTFSASGPKVNAREAKELVQAIAPGTDVYASDKPLSGGSLYVKKSYTPIGKTMVYATGRMMGINREDAKRLASKGGVVVAPVSPIANIGLGVAQSVMAQALSKYGLIGGAIGNIPLTLPGSTIRRIKDE